MLKACTDSFAWQPTLRGTTVTLRPLCPMDFDSLYAVARDPELWAQHPNPDRYQEPVFRGFFADAIASGGAFAIVESATDELIGSSRFHSLLPSEPSITIGYTFLARRFWGGKVNREIKDLMLRHAFQYVEMAYFHVGNRNFRSRRAMEKIGGRITGEMEKTVIYSIARTEFTGLLGKTTTPPRLRP